MANIARPLDAAAHASSVAHPRCYTLAPLTLTLTLSYALNFLDRTIFNVLIEPINKDIPASDRMLGLLAGFCFVLMYSLLGRSRGLPPPHGALPNRCRRGIYGGPAASVPSREWLF